MPGFPSPKIPLPSPPSASSGRAALQRGNLRCPLVYPSFVKRGEEAVRQLVSPPLAPVLRSRVAELLRRMEEGTKGRGKQGGNGILTIFSTPTFTRLWRAYPPPSMGRVVSGYRTASEGDLAFPA